MDGIEINTQTPRQALGQVTDEVMNYLRFLSDMGCSGLACSEKSMETIAAWGIVRGRVAALKAGAFRKTASGLPGAGADTGSAASRMQNKVPGPERAVPDTQNAVQDMRNAASGSWNRASDMQNGVPDRWDTTPETLERIRSDLGHCGRCGISHGRKNLVFGAGNPHARLMFIGEAPGPEEDSRGMPFVGAPGQLLTRMIEAMTLSREGVYLCNLVKCKPAGNRNPSPEEISNCYPFLERQIRAVKPEVICTLGAFATMAILGVTEGVSQLRGRFQAYQSIRVMPTFHPVFLLKNPGCKKAAWEDLQKVMAALGLKR